MDGLYTSVKIEGVEMGDLLEGLVVEESDSQADLATLTFGDPDQVLSDILHEGLSIAIDLGREETHALLFRGAITGIQSIFPQRGQATIEIQAIDSLVQLNYQPHTKRWWNTTVSQIVRDIAIANHLLPGTIELTDDALISESRPRQQVEATDLAFLHQLAQDYDCKLYVEHGQGPDTLNFVSTQSLIAAEPIEQTLAANENLVDFIATYDTFATAPEMRLVATDPKTGDRIEIAQALASGSDAQWTPDPERLAQARAGAARLTRLLTLSASKRSRLQDFWRVPPRIVGAPARPQDDASGTVGDAARRLGQSARGRASGSIWLRPRRRVVIQGYGGRWSGDWYLAQVRHEMNLRQNSYISSFVCTR
jgi:Phage tail baseplate hub (GPD)